MSNGDDFDMEGALNNLDQTFAKTEAAGEDGFKLPEGEYTFMIKNAEIRKAKSSARIHVMLHCVVAEGTHEGTPHYSYDLRFTDTGGKPDAQAMSFFKLACQRLGLGTPSDMSEARQAVDMMTNRVFSGRLKKNGDFLNLSILRLIHDNHTQWVTEGCPMPQAANRAADGW